MKIRFAATLLLVFLYVEPSFCQVAGNETQLYRYALKLEEDGKCNDALTIFKNLLRNDSGNVDYLWKTSYLYSHLGFAQEKETTRQQWYSVAASLAEKAVKMYPANANAHYAYAVALGRMNENAPNKTKIEYAKKIKEEAETAIRLNSKLAGAYHVLGRWHREVAGFSGFERTMIKTIFGDMPGGSYEEAIKNFDKAIKLEPVNILHYYELSLTYYKRDHKGDRDQAKNWLSKAMQIPAKNEDDTADRRKCESLLARLR